MVQNRLKALWGLFFCAFFKFICEKSCPRLDIGRSGRSLQAMARPLWISLLDKLEELYKTYGYCLNTLHSYEFDGSAGFAKMQSIMQTFRGGIKEFGGKRVVKLLDYAPGLDGLPKSDVLKFLLEDNCSVVVRPSGTEPKIKTYISISAENKETAEKIEAEICKSAEEYLK